VACSTTPSANVDAKSMNYISYPHEIPLSKVNKLIIEAGEEDGWRMTPFKENALIAEKIGDNSTEAVTVYFSTTAFHLSPENSDLADVIEEKLDTVK
jgi:hypothetical protein